jgi:acetolactate synthase-1/2/3 large subunit
MGPPCATGAAIACPDRVVINFQGDGGALSTPQALWTQAREGLHVVTLVCANRRYGVLDVEQQRAGIAPGPRASSLTDLSRPQIDWMGLARGFGVPAARADSMATFRQAFQLAIEAPGPHLIELQL